MKKTGIFVGAVAALGLSACNPPADESSESESTMAAEDEPIVDERTEDGDPTEDEDSQDPDDRTGPDDRTIPEDTQPDENAPTGPGDREAAE